MGSAQLLAYDVFPVLLLIGLKNAEPRFANLPAPENKPVVVKHSGSQDQSVHVAGHFYLERSPDGFGIRTHGVIERFNLKSKFYPLPQSNVETYKRLRPENLKNMWPPMLTAKDYRGQEVIGPYQVESNRLWFGNQYYDAEGDCGVGAFGYFDMMTRKYVVFSPRKIARWEISALLVEPDAVWLALDSFGEDISRSPGGLVRWDRNNHRILHYSLEFVVDRIRRNIGNSSALFLMTHGGYALLQDGKVDRFRVEKTPNGKKAAVRIKRFPPGTSIW